MCTQIRLLLQEQSDLGLNCLSKRLLKHFIRRQNQTTFIVIGTLKVNPKAHESDKNYSEFTTHVYEKKSLMNT